MNPNKLTNSPLETSEKFKSADDFFQEDYHSHLFRPEKCEQANEDDYTQDTSTKHRRSERQKSEHRPSVTSLSSDVNDRYGSRSLVTLLSELSDKQSVEHQTLNAAAKSGRPVTPLIFQPDIVDQVDKDVEAAETLLEQRHSKIFAPSTREEASRDLGQMLQHQTQTFSQRAAVEKLREWNSTEIDDRWDIKEGESYPEIPLLKAIPQWRRFVISASVDEAAEHYISKSERQALAMQIFAENMQKTRDSKERRHDQQEFLARRGRIHTPPPEVARLAYFLEQLEHGTGPLPRDMDENSVVIRKWLEENVFIEGEQPVPICDERAKKFTTYMGDVMTFERLRECVLRDIKEAVGYILSPAGEKIRGLLKARVVDYEASPSRNVDSPEPRVDHASPGQPFAHQVADIDGRYVKWTESQKQDSSTAGLPVDQLRNVKARISLEEGRNRLAIEDLQTVHKEAAALRKTHVDQLRAGTVIRAQSPHHTTAPTTIAVNTRFSPHTAIGAAPPITSFRSASTQVLPIEQKAKHQNTAESAHASNVLPEDASIKQFEALEFEFGENCQGFNFDPSSGILVPHEHFASQSPSIAQAQAQQLWATQHAAETIHQTGYPFLRSHERDYSASQFPEANHSTLHCNQPGYPALQYIPYSYPLQSAFGQPILRQGNQSSITGKETQISPTIPSILDQQLYVPPPIPSGRQVRPPAPYRVARMSMLPETFTIPTKSHGYESPTTSAHNKEWHNRYSPQPAVVPDLPTLPYRVGSDTMFPCSTGSASCRLQILKQYGLPTLDLLFAAENLPFAETTKLRKPAEWGVMKIGNIPYDVTKESIVNFLGPHAKTITPDFGPAIHIIMDRPTGKTMDCFVEFFSTPDARASVNSILLRSISQNRIGDRVVDVVLSSQEELMAQLFPKAKNVKWQGAKPAVTEATELFNTGFKCFVSLEELGSLVRHAEQPHRSNYTQRSPQRTYESMISLLAKYPWSDVAHYTVSTRTHIFQSVRQMLHILTINVRKSYNLSGIASLRVTPTYSGYGGDWPGHGGLPALTEPLLRDFLMAALNTPGFSEKQRWVLYDMSEYAKAHFRVSSFLKDWPFETLGRKPNVEEDVIDIYAKLIARHPQNLQPSSTRFGVFLNSDDQIQMEAFTMEKLENIEWTMLRSLLEGGLSAVAKMV